MKKILSIAVILELGMMLTACHNNNEQTSNKKSSQTVSSSLKASSSKSSASSMNVNSSIYNSSYLDASSSESFNSQKQENNINTIFHINNSEKQVNNGSNKVSTYSKYNNDKNQINITNETMAENYLRQKLNLNNGISLVNDSSGSDNNGTYYLISLHIKAYELQGGTGTAGIYKVYQNGRVIEQN